MNSIRMARRVECPGRDLPAIYARPRRRSAARGEASSAPAVTTSEVASSAGSRSAGWPGASSASRGGQLGPTDHDLRGGSAGDRAATASSSP
jgi:hypothetical protein